MYLKDIHFFLYPFCVGGVKEDNMAGKLCWGKWKRNAAMFLSAFTFKYRGLGKSMAKISNIYLALECMLYGLIERKQWKLLIKFSIWFY